MKFSSYKVNSKHRDKPTDDPKCSIWIVPSWEELKLFAMAYENGWKAQNKDILWAFSKTAIGRKNLKYRVIYCKVCC